jgi:hypothetical protein
MVNDLEYDPYVKELYALRKMYHAVLFNEWGKQGLYQVHKSKRHHNGSLCFGGDMFIVAAILPAGLISNHYYMKDWRLFQVRETERAAFVYDGHLTADVINRLADLLNK